MPWIHLQRKKEKQKKITLHQHHQSCKFRLQVVVQDLSNRQHAAVPQVLGEVGPVAHRPARVLRRVDSILIRPVPVGAVVVQEDVSLALDLVVPERCRPLDARVDDRAGAALPGEVPVQAVDAVVDKDGLERLVLHEADELRVAAGHGEDGEVDDVRGAQVDVGVGRREGDKVARVGVSDHGVRRRAGVSWVRCRVLLCNAKVRRRARGGGRMRGVILQIWMPSEPCIALYLGLFVSMLGLALRQECRANHAMRNPETKTYASMDPTKPREPIPCQQCHLQQSQAAHSAS